MTVPVLNPGQSFSWDQEAQSLDEAQSATYRYYLDMAATGIQIPTVQVTGTQSPFQCKFLAPLFPAGVHRIEFTADNSLGESARSLPFDFVIGSVMTAPRNIRIV